MCSVKIKVEGSGILQSSNSYPRILSPYTGEIGNVFVEENQFVRNGDPILVFDSNDINVEIRKNLEDQKRTGDELDDLDLLLSGQDRNLRVRNIKYWFEKELFTQQIKIQDLEIALIEKNHRRNKELFDSDMISEEYFELQKRQLETAILRKEQLLNEKRLEYLSEKRILEEKMEDLKKNLLLLYDLQRKRTIRANMAGHVIQLNVNLKGSYVNAGQELFCISPDSNVQVKFFVHTKDIALVHEGLKISYKIEALSCQEWGYAEGRVLSISKDIIVDDNGQPQYKVIGSIKKKIMFSKRTGRYIPMKKGMILQCNIILGEKRIIAYLFGRMRSKFMQ
jgi:multidrug resistance efflux pump